jgi:hypothetical protein
VIKSQTGPESFLPLDSEEDINVRREEITTKFRASFSLNNKQKKNCAIVLLLGLLAIRDCESFFHGYRLREQLACHNGGRLQALASPRLYFERIRFPSIFSKRNGTTYRTSLEFSPVTNFSVYMKDPTTEGHIVSKHRHFLKSHLDLSKLQ